MLSDDYYKLQEKLQHLIVVLNANREHHKSDEIYSILYELGMEYENASVQNYKNKIRPCKSIRLMEYKLLKSLNNS